MRPNPDSRHYRLFESTYGFFYGDGNAPEEPNWPLYLWRLLVVFPTQCIFFLIMIAMMIIIGIAGSMITIPLGLGIFYVEGFVPFRIKVRGRRIYLAAILIPLYLLVAFIYFLGAIALWCIGIVALCIIGIVVWRSEWFRDRRRRFRMV